MGLFSNSKRHAHKAASDAARGKDREGPETQYRVKLRARVPLADAGATYTVRLTGRATKDAIRRELSAEGYEVVRVEAKKEGQIFFW